MSKEFYYSLVTGLVTQIHSDIGCKLRIEDFKIVLDDLLDERTSAEVIAGETPTITFSTVRVVKLIVKRHIVSLRDDIINALKMAEKLHWTLGNEPKWPAATRSVDSKRWRKIEKLREFGGIPEWAVKIHITQASATYDGVTVELSSTVGRTISQITSELTEKLNEVYIRELEKDD